jgi:spore germination protein KC
LGVRLIKTKIFFLFLLLTLILTSGCWSKKEVEELAIVSAIGIDREEINGKPKWRMTFQIFSPQASSTEGAQGSQSGKVWTVPSVGETLDDARMNLNTRTPRVIFAAHATSIVIGEETARTTNLTEIVDYLLRHKEFRLRNWLLVTKGTAFNMLAVKPELEQNVAAAELDNIIKKTSQRISKATVMNVKEVAEAVASSGQDVITGLIETEKSNLDSKDEQRQKIRLHGASIFSKDRMVGVFSDTETRGYLYIMGKAQQTSLPLTLGQSETPNVSISMINSKSKITPYFKDQQLSFKVDIYAESDLIEIQKFEHVTPELLELLEHKAAQLIKKEAEQALAKAQELSADIFGLGSIVYHKEPKYWKEIKDNWRDYFINLPVEINVKVDIRRTGMITHPILTR